METVTTKMANLLFCLVPSSFAPSEPEVVEAACDGFFVGTCGHEKEFGDQQILHPVAGAR